MSAESLSVRLRISGENFPPQEALSVLLAGVARALGPGFLGHVKGIARFPEGILYASTVGVPQEVTLQPFGQIPLVLSAMDFELTCIAIGLEHHRLRGAVEEALAAAADKYQIEGNFHERTHHH